MKKSKMILLSCLLAVCLAWGMIPDGPWHRRHLRF